jgi:hypothetical protein
VNRLIAIFVIVGLLVALDAPGNAARGVAPALRSFTASNFRTNLGRLTGGIREGAQAHHVFPQKFGAAFEKAGINIHDPRFGAWWESGSHLKNASSYNAAWSEFFATTRNPTAEQIFQFGRNLSAEYGIPIGF